MEEISLKRIEKDLPLPAYQTKKSAAFDLYAAESVEIKPQEHKIIRLGVAIKLPKNHMGLLVPRSSLFKKKGLMMANSAGIIDEDYCSEKDEYMASLLNVRNETVSLEKGERICQLIVVPITRVQINEVEKLEDDMRGGFGSTD